MSDPSRTFINKPSTQQQCLLVSRLPSELLTMILELVLLPQLPLTIRKTDHFQRYRPEELNTAINEGQGSCQAQLLRTCQLAYTCGLNILYEKATFRLSIHCEGRNNMARTADPRKPGQIGWVPVLYSRSFGRKLLRRFRNIYLEVIPDMGGTSQDGIFITWTSTGVIVDTYRFLSHRLKGKNLIVNITTPNLEIDRITLDELGIWLGSLEVLRVKSLECPQFKHWMKANRSSCPIALITSDEPIVDLEVIRLDFITVYFEKMRSVNQAADRYYDEVMSTRFREKAHQFNVREFIYLRNLYIDRIENVTKESFERPVEHERKLLEIYSRFTQVSPLENNSTAAAKQA